MSIKKDFNYYISKNIKGKVDELSLIDALIYSLDKNGAYTCKYHGIKGLVQFDINVSSPLISYANVKCEIADIFIIFIGQDEIRYTFLQNKYSRVGGSDHLIPKVNTRQHYLLSERVLFNPLKTGLPSNILKSGLCHGAGSYGDFFNNDLGYDMRYFVSKTLFPKNNRAPDFYGRKKARSFFNTYLENNWLNYINGKFECSHVSNLDDFEIMAKRMLIGSPVDIKDKDLSNYFAKLVRFVIRSSNKLDDGLLDRLNTMLPTDDKADDVFVEPTFSNYFVVLDFSKRVTSPLYNKKFLNLTGKDDYLTELQNLRIGVQDNISRPEHIYSVYKLGEKIIYKLLDKNYVYVNEYKDDFISLEILWKFIAIYHDIGYMFQDKKYLSTFNSNIVSASFRAEVVDAREKVSKIWTSSYTADDLLNYYYISSIAPYDEKEPFEHGVLVNR